MQVEDVEKLLVRISWLEKEFSLLILEDLRLESHQEFKL